MRTINKILLGTALVLSITNATAQQDAMYTHYMYNTLAVNPAYAGTRDALTMTALMRNQWVGFNGAPRSITGTMHTPIGERIGFGLSFVNDKIGPLQNNQIYADIAYHLKLSEKAKLSFGIKGGVNLWSANLGTLKTLNDKEVDPSQYNYSISNNITPNVGAGVYYYRERFYMGVSVPKLMRNTIGSTQTVGNTGNTTNLITEQIHWFAIIGTVFNLSPIVKLKPTALLKETNAAPLQGDFTGTFIFNDKLNLGAMYRTGDAAGLLLGFNLNPQLYAGYSFDWSFVNSTSKYNNGSHEIMLRYDLIYNDKKQVKSPRYF